MNDPQWWLGLLGEIILVVVLLGILVRRRAASCYSFTVYIVAVLVCEVLITAWPVRFHTWNFWVFKEILLIVLKFAIALELAARTFRAFPGARSTARGVALLVVLISLAAVLSLPAPTNPGFPELASQVVPRIVNGTIWLFTALAAVILWYRLPVDLFHKAILVGFVPYLLVFTVALNLLVVFEGEAKWLAMASYLQSVAYVLLLGYWGYAAWRPLEGRVRAPEARREATQPL
jgi:hypothetical protein